jgi:transcriptional regulator GlxA family with amidase domain
MKPAPHRVWFVGSAGPDLLDITGPWAVLGHANDVIGAPAYQAQLVEPLGGEVRSRHGLTLVGARSLAEAARRGLPDTLIVAGAAASADVDTAPVSPAAQAAQASQAHLVRWLRAHHRRIPRLVSICRGAFVLAEAGLLDGRRATTHWRFAGDLERRFPKVRVAASEIYVRDGKVWTSAGITAGIDLALALLEADRGRAVAMAVARLLVLFLRRSGGQSQFSETLKRQEREPSRLRDLAAFVVEHVGEPLPVERLARALGMSPRSVSRWCRDELGESPAAMVRRLRVEEARRLLETTPLPLKDVASRTGLGDPSTLWRVFAAQLGVTPAAYRGRFGPQRSAASS